MLRRIALVAGMFVWSLWSLLPACGQDPVVGQTFGRGVHAYYAGDYYRAYDLLSAAIRGGTTDPRAWYFRGLVYLRLGREDEAKQDFAEGAKRELTDVERTFQISRSLERVQGADRALLEQYRTEARMLAMQRAEEQRKARYEQLRREEARVLLQPQAPGPGSSVPFGTPPSTAPGAKGEPGQPPTEPFEVEPAPAKAATMPEVDPFAPVPTEEPAPGAKSAPAGQMPAEKPGAAEEEPFGGPPPAVPKPAAKKPAAKGPAAEEEEEPFGAPPPAVPKPAARKPAAKAPAAKEEEEPFGAPPPAVPKPGAKPSGAAPPGDEAMDEDVFGAGPSSKPAAKKTAPKKSPAKKATQPQGSPFGADPFGGNQ